MSLQSSFIKSKTFLQLPLKNIFHSLLTAIFFQPFLACQNVFSQSLLFHSFFFFPFSFWTLLPCCLSYAVCPFPFILGTRQAYVSLSLFLQLLTNCFHFLTFILSSSLHCLSLLFHQPDIVVQTDTIALDSAKHVLSIYECQIQQIQQRQPGHVTQIRFLLKILLLNSKCRYFLLVLMSAFVFTFQDTMQYNLNYISLLQNS